MKRLFAAAVLSVLGLSSNAYSQPINSGFETGDTTGWVETYPDVEGVVPNINVVTNWTSDKTFGSSGSWPVTYKPVEGNYFTVLGAGDLAHEFAMLSQRISLNRGDTLEGSASFCCGSEVYYPTEPIDSMNFNDYASISVLNSQGNIVAEPWHADSYDLGYIETNPQGEIIGGVDFGPLPWQHWSWTAPESGNYTLEYKTTQGGDLVGASYALFDGPRDKSTAVPEPSSMILFGLASAGIFAAHRSSRFDKGKSAGLRRDGDVR